MYLEVHVGEKKIWNRMTANVLNQDPDTKRFKEMLIYFDTVCVPVKINKHLFEPFCAWIMLERTKSAETWKLMLSWPVSSVCSAQASASGKLGCWGERGGDRRMVGVPHLPPQCQVPISVRSGQHQIYPPARHPKIYRWVMVHLNHCRYFTYVYSLPLSVRHSSSLSSFSLSQNWKLISSLSFLFSLYKPITSNACSPCICSVCVCVHFTWHQPRNNHRALPVHHFRGY